MVQNRRKKRRRKNSIGCYGEVLEANTEELSKVVLNSYVPSNTSRRQSATPVCVEDLTTNQETLEIIQREMILMKCEELKIYSKFYFNKVIQSSFSVNFILLLLLSPRLLKSMRRKVKWSTLVVLSMLIMGICIDDIQVIVLSFSTM